MARLRWSSIALALAAGCGSNTPASFHPTANATIPGGTHSYVSFTIPAGVTASVAADAILQVSGDVSIAGNLVGDCVGIDLEGQGAIEIAGKLDNRCSAAGSKDLIIRGKKLTIGKAGAPAALGTSGNLDVANDATIQPSDFAVLPSQRSATPLAPSCAASASALVVFASADLPASLKLSASAAAPGGGGLAYRWDFGDGASASGAQADHRYAPGSYAATLTVTGDDGKTCTSTLRLAVLESHADAAPSAASGAPALSIAAAGVVAAAGETLPFSADAFSPSAEALTYAWDFGDGTTSADAAPSHAFAQSGRYAVTLSATDADANVSTATMAVYVYPAAARTSSRRLRTATASSCSSPDFNATVTGAPPGVPAFGSDGNRIDLRASGDLVIGGGTRITAQDGRYGQSDEAPTALGGDGGRGGAISILATGALTLCDGVVIAGASGGDGGNAGAEPGYAAKSGRGGDSGPITVKAAGGVTVSGNVSVTIGAGGNAGNATVYGAAPGGPSCAAGAGIDTMALGASGGSIKDVDLPSGLVVSSGGPGGKAGNASATGGAGQATLCDFPSVVENAGKGGNAKALSKAGGSVLVAGLAGSPAIVPGSGGTASARGGDAGSATAPPQPCVVAIARGGGGGNAFAFCDGPGTSTLGTRGGPCISSAIAGNGATATASGAPCPSCQSATRAEATAGKGGDAAVGVPGDPASSTSSAAIAGNGGDATAVGGNAAACDTCPGGAGGAGGRAASSGGAGGTATASGAGAQTTQGRGGDATSTGGTGGAGASCCPAAGGSGGSGGAASATIGAGPGGQSDSGGAGNGGHGGDGTGAGAGGAGGAGSGTPTKLADGTPGSPGNACTPTGTCASIGNAAACGTFVCGTSATAGCDCGTDPSCRAGQPDFAEGGGARVYQYSGLSNGFATQGSGISAAFTAETQAPLRTFSALTNTNTIYGDAGQCVRWDYSGTFPTTTNLDLGTLTVTVGPTTTTATQAVDLSYFKSSTSLLWTGAGQTVTLAASGAGSNAPFSVSGSSPAAFTVTAPVLAPPPTHNTIPTGSDYVVTWTGAADGSSLVVTLYFDASTATAGSEVVCTGQGGSLTIPAALLQGLPASSTGVISVTQTVPLTVSGSGFSWTNQLAVTPVDAQGALIGTCQFQLSP